MRQTARAVLRWPSGFERDRPLLLAILLAFGHIFLSKCCAYHILDGADRVVLGHQTTPNPCPEVFMSSIPTLTKSVAQRPSTQRAAQPQQNNVQRASFQQERWLVDIPVSVLSEHSAWTAAGNWQGMFDCAIWLRTPAGLAHPVQLSLKYIDNSGEKIVHIDRCHPGSHRTVLLNGSFGLGVNGRVRDMGLYLLGITDPEIVVEEWHMTPQQRRAR